ncbi:hypothetical protein NDU88_004924 [Pleurodeles waltl]|uniref:Uncharacterized protein n=1 Tax=Pleurodeles waltl TaxID=8319 RepID=A0AAV7MBB9_PLEWA|nr:hypothetical protein NDU88_004924 [Pleurodeles waltl]
MIYTAPGVGTPLNSSTARLRPDMPPLGCGLNTVQRFPGCTALLLNSALVENSEIEKKEKKMAAVACLGVRQSFVFDPAPGRQRCLG